MTGERYDRIVRAMLDAMHAHDRDPLSAFGSSRCDRCGAPGALAGILGEEVELFVMISPRGALVQVCDTCGDLCRCTPTPPCAGAPGLCGAPAGKPCEPGCPTRTATSTHPDGG